MPSTGCPFFRRSGLLESARLARGDSRTVAAQTAQTGRSLASARQNSSPRRWSRTMPAKVRHSPCRVPGLALCNRRFIIVSSQKGLAKEWPGGSPGGTACL